jgi:hypothetical protein
LHRYGSGDRFAAVSKILRFRRRNRPGWKTGMGKRLKGLAQAVRPSVVARLEQMKRQKRLRLRAMLAGGVLLCFAAIGWALI